MSTRTVQVPWAAWHGDTTHTLHFPASWQVDVLTARGGPELSDAAIEAALSAPVAAPPLEHIAAGRRTACVVTDDLARPTRMERPLRAVLQRIEAAGVPREGITVVVATGTHPVLDNADLRLKLGSYVVDTYRVECHDAKGTLAPSGVNYGDRPLMLNRTFLAAELRVLLGSVIPHPFAGFSAGAKMVLPGLADVESTERTHKFVLLGLRAPAEVGSNAFRSEIEALVERIGVHWIVGVVPTLQREPGVVVAGDLVRAHRTACAAAVDFYHTEFATDYDCLVVNAYPKDVDLIQSQNALGAPQRIKPYPVRDGGVVVLATAAARGIGRHGLFEPGGRTYRAPARNRALGDRSIWLYAPDLPEERARLMHWSGYPVHQAAAQMAAQLESTLGSNARAGVVPVASLQWLVDRRQDAV